MLLSLISLTVVIVGMVAGHGMVLNPVARASRWRFYEDAPTNFDDNGLFCGGFIVQWDQNDGKCGLCGDNYADPRPRANELGGEFGDGQIVGTYVQGGLLPVDTLITANHYGFFTFALCNLDNGSEDDDCFEKHPLRLAATGEERYPILTNAVGFYNTTLRLPADLVCEHCVLQWTYNTGKIVINFKTWTYF